MAIRRYGPGKYNTILDSYVHGLSLDGWEDESAGGIDEVGIYYGRFQLGSEAAEAIEADAGRQKDELTDEEKDRINNSFGAIISENDQGFVYIDYYDTEKAYDKAWEEVEESVEGGEEEEGEEDGEEEEEESEEEEEEEAEV